MGWKNEVSLTDEFYGLAGVYLGPTIVAAILER